MGLTTMQWRQPAQRSGTLFGTDDDPRPHDEAMEDAWIADARAAVVKKVLLGCEVTDDELSIADISMAEAAHEAALLLERTETQRKRLTEPPEPAEPQLPRLVSHTVDVEPEPEPKRPRRKRDKTKTLMREAMEFKREESALFAD